MEIAFFARFLNHILYPSFLVPILVRTKIFDTTALGVALVAAHSLDMDVFNVQGKTYER